MSDESVPNQAPRLRCLDGAPAPSELLPSLSKANELSPEAQEAFPQFVRQVLGQAPDEQVDEIITNICQNNELSVDVAGTAIKATRYVFRQAAAYNLAPQELAEDFAAIGCSEELMEQLVSLYGQVQNELRTEIAQATIIAHGNVLTGVEWRVDTLGASNRGRGLNVPLAVITLTFRTGEETKRLTVQALPDALRALRDVCNNMLS